MDTLNTILKLNRPACYMTTLDLKEAYYTVPAQKYLKFVFDDVLYKYLDLPNGLCSGPRKFTKLLNYIIAEYLADIFNTHMPYNKCLEGVINSRTSDKEKKGNITKICTELIRCNFTSIQKVSSVSGALVSCFPRVKFGKLFYRNLEHDKTSALKNNSGKFDFKMQIATRSKKELQWWVDNILTSFNTIGYTNPDLVIETDASNTGWGAVSESIKINEFWDKNERDLHTNALELKQFDNTTAVFCIKKMGTSHSLICNDIVFEIWTLAKVWINGYLFHIPGKENNIADSDAWGVNAFLFDWKDFKFYAFPRFSLIPKVLQKIFFEKATGVFVVRNWPYQRLYSQYQEILIGDPIFISPRKHLLNLPLRLEVTQPIDESLTQLIGIVSGKLKITRQYSALNTARSALTIIMEPQYGINFGRQPIMKRYMHGEFKLRLPRYSFTYDIDIVLKHLESLGDPDKLPLKIFNIPDLFIRELLKTSRPAHNVAPLEILKYDLSRNICLVENLKQYLKITFPLRGLFVKLFRSIQAPHKPVCTSTLSRWKKHLAAEKSVNSDDSPGDRFMFSKDIEKVFSQHGRSCGKQNDAPSVGLP
ncbi:uncharacterized protein LOC130627599 [Hydractinia symbiolongicarpus]|uniref:uncharacterized protein LOC130627599 n=1 Tax=Hydractinia symbiolongicarpus TaxID=13093 RepID=UPI0025501E7F|nr:uncharacterized protein LOC130627599 [Hydractinia symbiolongicarpus]